MIIIAHRGIGEKLGEINSLSALKKSIKLGFGIETDIRDYNSNIVISHDIPSSKSLRLDILFEYYANKQSNLTLALNVKSDGLQIELKELIVKYNISNYFVFDMSVPDALQYINHGFNVFTRQSEYEREPSFYELASGIWIDQFNSHWTNNRILVDHIERNKKICVVSPELHGRRYIREWVDLKEVEKIIGTNNLMLCSDYPEKAKDYFND